MITLFKKQPVPTVEQIHAEIDSAESKILDECERVLNTLNILTQSKIEKKADLMLELGFKSSETIKQAEKLKEDQDKLKNVIVIADNTASLIRGLKLQYFEKFLTIDEFDRICNKYNLIYAKAEHYIKDVPEKNLLEIKNAKKLNSMHVPNPYIILTIDRFYSKLPENIKKILSGELKIDDCNTSQIESLIRGVGDGILKDKFNINYSGYLYHTAKVKQIDKSGLHIAAPKSHFDLKNLSKQTKYGYFNVKSYEIKDPIAFEFVKGGLVRIISKWGTDDDKSYLDESLTNETLN